MIFAAPGVHERGVIHMILLGAAVATMLLAILGAFGERRIRRMLSLLLISHVGYLIFGIAMMGDSERALGATLMYMSQEMVVMAALFMCCGMIEKHAGSDNLDEIGGVLSRSPWLATAFFLCFASVVGIPPLPGFFGKFVLITEGFSHEDWWVRALVTPCVLLTAVLTMAVMVKIWAFAFWGRPALAAEGCAKRLAPASGLRVRGRLASSCGHRRGDSQLRTVCQLHHRSRRRDARAKGVRQQRSRPRQLARTAPG